MDLGTFRAFICDDRFDQLAVFQRGDGGQKTPLRRRSFLDPKEDLSFIQGVIHHHLHPTIQESFKRILRASPPAPSSAFYATTYLAATSTKCPPTAITIFDFFISFSSS